jgi:hypothetical protein
MLRTGFGASHLRLIQSAGQSNYAAATNQALVKNGFTAN